MRFNIFTITIVVCLLATLFIDHTVQCFDEEVTHLPTTNPPIRKTFKLLYDDDEFESITGDELDIEDDIEADKDDEKGTIAKMIDSALKEEFKHEEEKQAEVGKQFNETVSRDEGTQETVVIISQKKEKERAANRTAALENAAAGGDTTDFITGSSGDSSSSLSSSTTTTTSSTKTTDSLSSLSSSSSSTASDSLSLSSSSTDSAAESSATTKSHIDVSVETDVDRIIDSHDNEYVLSKPNEEGSMGLTLDPQFIRDLGVLIATAALAGFLMEAAGQPTINGYFVAGSLVGPGGLHWVKEIVQVQSVAQLGVQFLLFTLGIEMSLTKLRAVRDVALLGGLLEIAIMTGMGAAGAAIIGVGIYKGAFVGALVAMSSTSVVVKCLQESRSSHQSHGQITIGTLVLQDCVVGLLFAFMPVVASAAAGSNISIGELLSVAGRVFAMLLGTCVVAIIVSVFILPTVARTVSRFSAETFQMSVLGFCLVCAMATTRLGISSEVGSFLAGMLLSATEYQESILAAAEPASHLFLALFIASTGLTIAPSFLAEHILVLAAGVAVVITAKTIVIAGVVLIFRYPADTALAVGINLAQIGEFGFVLLSIAFQHSLIGNQVYLLLMGTTALSLLVTPFLLQVSAKLIPRAKESSSSLSSPSMMDDHHLLPMSPAGVQKRRSTVHSTGVNGSNGTTTASNGRSSAPVAVEKQHTSLQQLSGLTTHRRSGHSRSSSGENVPV